MGQAGYARGDDATIPPLAEARAAPTSRSTTTYALECGGRRLELISVPGGETIDSLVVWLPDDARRARRQHVLGAVRPLPEPRDRARRPPAQRARVRRLGATRDRPRARAAAARPSRTGAGRVDHPRGVRADPRRGAVRARRDGRGHERRARRVDRDARPFVLPDALELGEAYGRVDWSVRAIWETYAGWFHQHSTLELYGASPEQGANEIVALAGGTDAVAHRAADLVTTRSAHAPCACASSRSPSTPSIAARSTRTGARTSSYWSSTDARTSGSPAGSKARCAA